MTPVWDFDRWVNGPVVPECHHSLRLIVPVYSLHEKFFLTDGAHCCQCTRASLTSSGTVRPPCRPCATAHGNGRAGDAAGEAVKCWNLERLIDAELVGGSKPEPLTVDDLL